MPKFINLVGMEFGRLKVLYRVENSKNNKVQYFCECTCGNTKVIIGTSLSKNSTKSCGCLSREIKSLAMTGEGNPMWDNGASCCGAKNNNWKGGISGERLDNKDHKVWRLKVFTNDDFICQKCSSVGGRLNAHHILSFSRFEHARYLVDNGVTLCEACHREFHKLYSYTDFTLEDYEEWMNQG